MAQARFRDLTGLSIVYLAKSVYSAVIVFAAIAILTLPMVLAITEPADRAIALLVILGMAAYVSNRQVLFGTSEEEYNRLSTIQKGVALMLAFGYYNLLVFVGVVLYLFVDASMGPILAALVAVVYPIYDSETAEYPNPFSVGGWIYILMRGLEALIHSAEKLRELTLSDVPFIVFVRTHRRPGLR